MNDHIAILAKRWNLLEMILNGTKTIESRWYINRVAPWNRIFKGETVYFKETGGRIRAKAVVDKVLQFEGIEEPQIREILGEYAVRLGKKPQLDSKPLSTYYDRKRYCILIFLKDVEELAEPFQIDKTGYGNSSAWLVTPDIEKIRIT